MVQRIESDSRAPAPRKSSKSRKSPAVKKIAAAGRRSRASSRMPDVAAVLIDSRRKDLEALTAASRKSYEGLQAVVQRQVTLVKYALREWQSVAVVMKIAGARDSAAHLDRLGRGALELALSSIRELAQLAVTTQADALNVIKRRIDEDLEEVSRLLHPQAPQPVAARKRVRKVAAKTAKSI